MEHEDRTCNKHGITKHYLDNGKSRKRWKCIKCNSDAIYRRKLKLKAELVDLAGGSCVRCGYNQCTDALEFHHINPSTKQFNICRMTSHSRQKVLEEAKKCILVCSNCHKEIEHEGRVV